VKFTLFFYSKNQFSTIRKKDVETPEVSSQSADASKAEESDTEIKNTLEEKSASSAINGSQGHKSETILQPSITLQEQTPPKTPHRLLKRYWSFLSWIKFKRTFSR